MTETFRPDETDLRILTALQDDIPLEARPWKAIADRLAISEAAMLARIQRMKNAGIIRGISPVLESHRLGLHAATLVALHVPDGRVDAIAALINNYPEVSHNFQRDHYYSLWFTIAAEDGKGIRRVLDDIRSRTGISPEDILNLPTEKKIKIDVRFRFVPVRPGEVPDGRD
ncbi:MAG: AsnC family transcriptional regulator [Methanoregula sp.]|jgi:DNA-binding Lrp family transcriptional regulator|nr:AsnC family transcriptional regulator [Methanoregula sp.]